MNNANNLFVDLCVYFSCQTYGKLPLMLVCIVSCLCMTYVELCVCIVCNVFSYLVVICAQNRTGDVSVCLCGRFLFGMCYTLKHAR